jgi:hypothetical protein
MPSRPKPRSTKQTIHALVQEHRKLKDEPLHLAVQLADPKHPTEIVLREVIGGFGGGHVDPDKQFLVVAVSPSTQIDLPPGGELRLVLTSPEELKEASTKNWPALQRLQKKTVVAVHHADKTGQALRALLFAA